MYLDFEFNNKRLSDYGYTIGSITTGSGIKEVDIGSDITFNTIKNNNSSVHYVTSSVYDNVYAPQIEIFKTPCQKKTDELYITDEDMKLLTKWLNVREYKKIKLINNVNSSMNIVYYGSFNIKQIMLNDNIIGLLLILTTNAPFGFGEMVTLKYDIKSSGEHFFIYGDSDEVGTIFPEIYVKSKANNQTIIITNLTTNTEVRLENCSENEIIYVNNEFKIIKSDKRIDSDMSNNFNYNYFDILIDEDVYSKNEYVVSAPCEITIRYSPIRKIGVC